MTCRPALPEPSDNDAFAHCLKGTKEKYLNGVAVEQ